MQELQDGDPERIGPYRVLGRLGSGGMGRVFLGRSAGGRLLAIKVIRAELADDREFRLRFGREVDAARRVSGVFTASVVDADVDAATPWLATAYVQGPSLAEVISIHGPLPVDSLLALAAGLAEGLAAIHAAGLVHRDLKPSNVLLAADGPRVIDFGISRAAEVSALTGTGLVVGSPGFMSPEQADGREVGPPSDVFSLGALLTFAGTGQGPFGAGSTAALLYRVVHNPPETAGLPERVRLVADRCMNKDPLRRPTPVELLAELEAAQPIAGWLPQSFTDQFRPDQASGPGQTAPGNAVVGPGTVTTAGSAPDQGAAQVLAPTSGSDTAEQRGTKARERRRPRRTVVTVIALPVLLAMAAVLVLLLQGRPTAGGHPTKLSSSQQAVKLTGDDPCRNGPADAAVVGTICFNIPQEFYESVRESDFLTAYWEGSTCPNGLWCGSLIVLTGTAYDEAFAGQYIGDPDQGLGLAFSKPLNFDAIPATAVSAGGGKPCGSQLTDSGNQPFGSMTAEYRQWSENCPNSSLTQVQAWRIPESKVIVIASALSELGSTSIQTMVAHAVFVQGTAGTLPSPTLIAPQDGSVFSNYPRTTKMSWGPVSGATNYFVQVQPCSQNGCESSSLPYGANINGSPYSAITHGTRYTIDFFGAQPGRWRVAAIQPDGELGQFSSWRGFIYTR